MIFGLTGGIASGKSTVTNLFRAEEGVSIVDADKVAREIVAPGTRGLEMVVAAFGPDILQKDGHLDRPKLGAIVFADPTKRRLLDGILGLLIEQVIAERTTLLQRKYPLVGVDAALIFEKGLDKQYKPVVVVAVDEEIQIARVMERDNFTREEAQARIKAQLPLAEKVARADFVIWNNEGLPELEAKVKKVLEQLKALA